MYVIIRRLMAPVDTKSFQSNSPSRVHYDLVDAKAEALRLAALNINSYFDVFSLIKVGDAYGRVATEWSELERPVRKRK
jgi:hypothetical protein